MSENPELWASVDKKRPYARCLWTKKPHGERGEFLSENGPLWLNQQSVGSKDALCRAIFPEGIAPGECKPITIERAKIVEADK